MRAVISQQSLLLTKSRASDLIPALDKFRIEIGKLTKFTHKQGKFLKGIRLKFMQIVQICTSLIYISPGVIQVKHRLAWIINLERQREDHPLKERCLSAYVYCICDVGIKVVCCLDHRF